METQLTIKHLAAYLPFGLKILNHWDEKGLLTTLFVNGEYDSCMIKTTNDDDECLVVECKPILRPLSDLTKEIEVNGEKFYPIEKYNYDFGLEDDYLYEFQNSDGSFDVNDCKNLPKYVFDWLASLHFDVFGLIPAGLAIDINTLER